MANFVESNRGMTISFGAVSKPSVPLEGSTFSPGIGHYFSETDFARFWQEMSVVYITPETEFTLFNEAGLGLPEDVHRSFSDTPSPEASGAVAPISRTPSPEAKLPVKVEHLNKLVLDVSRVFSDRLIASKEGGILSLRADTSFNGITGLIKRLIQWIFPCFYSDKNRETIGCVKKYLIDQIGQNRLNRICARYQLKNLDHLQATGGPLMSRDLAKILVGANDVKVEDIEELIQFANSGNWPERLPHELRLGLIGKKNSEQLDTVTFKLAFDSLALDMAEMPTLAPLADSVCGGAPTDGGLFGPFDRFLADRERLSISAENHTETFITFVHNFVVRTIAREPSLGTLIPAPNRAGVDNEFYRVSGKVITAEGMVSYILMPANSESSLKPIRFYRGTATSMTAIDMASTIKTDAEHELGRTAFESGTVYREKLKEELGVIPQAAGHSLGSTTLQYDVVENGDLTEVFLFNGPGLPAKEVARFNERMRTPESQEITVHVRDMHTDKCSSFGEQHIGYNPDLDRPDLDSAQIDAARLHKVHIDYAKYYPPVEYVVKHGILGVDEPEYASKTSLAVSFAHVVIPDRGSSYNRITSYTGIEGGHSEMEVNRLLNREKLDNSHEKLRKNFLGPIIYAIASIINGIIRFFFGSRAMEERGLHVGKFEADKWITKHYRLEDLDGRVTVAS